ncbi:DoxX family protein [Massilia agilis]|uniref:DoxX family protein n=1 Tax=Massilia agilis TaxID=1811226 RepID=A0ABT2D6G1_9BURK|nr:DoxX family protein [Massilia agilis]MCS0806389.1 DoxX family protein [Massilia agilis]
MDALLNLLARILMSQIFIVSGFGKITGYAGTQQYMQAAGVPGFLLPIVILVELGGGLALLFGVKARWAALLLAGFSLASALLFHLHPGDQMQMINFMKNLAMAGGLLMVTRHGAGRPSLDHRLERSP